MPPQRHAMRARACVETLRRIRDHVVLRGAACCAPRLPTHTAHMAAPITMAEVKALVAKREAMEKEIEELTQWLTAPGRPGMRGGLTDKARHSKCRAPRCLLAVHRTASLSAMFSSSSPRERRATSSQVRRIDVFWCTNPPVRTEEGETATCSCEVASILCRPLPQCCRTTTRL